MRPTNSILAHRFTTLIIGLALAAFAVHADDSVQVVTLPNRPYDVCIDPSTGAFAVVYPELDTVALYPRLATGSIEGAITVKVPKLPIDIAYKRIGDRSMFLVVCLGANSMVVLDAASLGQLKVIPLAVAEPSQVTTTLEATDVYAWYCGGRGHDAKVARVNLATLTDEGPLDVRGASDNVMDFALSAGGKLAYIRGSYSPSGRACMELVAPTAPGGKWLLQQVSHVHTDADAYVPDETGELCATGQKLFDATLMREVAKLSVAPSLFLPTQPFCLGLDGSNLVALSLNSFRVAGSVYLPIKLPTQRQANREDVVRIADDERHADFKRFEYRPRMVYESISRSVVVLAKNTACVVPLAALSLPDEPLLIVAVDAIAPLAPGQASRIGLSRRDPRTKLELRSGPAGLMLDGDGLVWTPAEDQIGEHNVELRASHGDAERPFTVHLKVTRPRIALGFAPGMVALSSDARFAAVVSNPREHGEQRTGPQLVSLDLVAGKVLARIPLPVLPRAIAIDEKHVYVAPSDAHSVLAVAVADLSEVRRVFTNGAVTRMVVVGSRLVAFTDSSRVDVFTRGAELTPSTLPGVNPEISERGHRERGDEAITWIGPDRVMLDGLVYDATCDRILEVARMDGLDTVSFGREGGRESDAAGNRIPWGVEIGQGVLSRPGNQVICRFEARASALLLDQPVLASLVVTRKRESDDAIERGEIVFRDLDAGSPRSTLALYAHVSDNSSHDYTAPRLIAGPGVLLAFVGTELYVVRPPKLATSALPAPFQCVPSVGLGVIDGSAPATSIELKCTGFEAPLRYSLQGERGGFQIVGDKVEISTSVAFDLVVERLRHFVPRPDDDARSKVHLDAYLVRASARFRQVTGRAPKGVPAVLACAVRVVDGSNRFTQASFAVLLDVPMERFGIPARPDVSVAPAPGTDEALRKRIAELEQRVRELEAELKLERGR